MFSTWNITEVIQQGDWKREGGWKRETVKTCIGIPESYQRAGLRWFSKLTSFFFLEFLKSLWILHIILPPIFCGHPGGEQIWVKWKRSFPSWWNVKEKKITKSFVTENLFCIFCCVFFFKHSQCLGLDFGSYLGCANPASQPVPPHCISPSTPAKRRRDRD